jgi:hypothetical protein
MKPEIKTLFERKDPSKLSDYYIHVHGYLSIYEIVARTIVGDMILAYAHLDDEDDVEDTKDILRSLITFKYPNINEVPEKPKHLY